MYASSFIYNRIGPVSEHGPLRELAKHGAIGCATGDHCECSKY